MLVSLEVSIWRINQKKDVAKALIICANACSCEFCPYKDFDYAVEKIHCNDQVMMDTAEYLSEE